MMEGLKDALREAIRSRRSTRRYRPDPVPEDLLTEVVEAGRFAPSGNNRQSTHFIVVADPRNLAGLREAVTAALANMPIQDGMSPTFVGLIKKAQAGTGVDVTCGAPALILTANRTDNGNAMADCACAQQNMMLMATACGLGNCWINQFGLLGKEPPLRSLMEGLGLAADEAVYGALALGYAEKLETEPLPRTGNPVTRT